MTYAWAVRRLSVDQAEFDTSLAAPLPGEKNRAPSPADMEDEGSAFMAFMGEVTGG